MKKTTKIISIFLILCFAFLLKGGNIVKAEETILHVDYPMQENLNSDKLYIEGWYLTHESNIKLQILLDGKDRTNEIKREERTDVLNAYQNFEIEKNKTPGFLGTLDLSEEKDGIHNLQILLKNGNNIISSQERKIILNKYSSILHIDYPNNTEIKGSKIYLEGWMLASTENHKFQILIDNKDVTNSIENVERQDVLNANPNYNKEINKLPGFQGNLDISKIKDGKHEITFKVINTKNNETMQEQKREIILKKYDLEINVDYPKNDIKTNNNLYVEGWIMSENPNTELKFKIDDKYYTNEIEREERADVINAVKGYGGKETNKTPGFKGNINLSDLNYGKHNLKIEVYYTDSGEKILTVERNFTLRPNETLFNCDYPSVNQKTNKNLYVEGWVMSEEPDFIVNVKIDNIDYTENIERFAREDVWNAVKDYGGKENNPYPGFKGNIDLSNLKDGNHTVKIQVLSQKGKIIKEEIRNITVNKYKSIINIDYPKQLENYENELYIEGWFLSELENKEIKIYLDNTDVTNQVQFVERKDVTNSVTGYGVKEENMTPGIKGNIDISQIKAENKKHQLVFKLINKNTSEEMINYTVNIYINQIPYEEGYYGYSGLAALGDSRGSDLKYYKIGNGPNVFFATFSVHGFEDLWNNDGTELTLIAEDLKGDLLNMQDKELAEKWTIYIFPEVNPDGRKYGYTNNGPGRTTLYSWAPANQGIDLNRSWQIGNNYTRYTDSRNYNGTEGFQAYEARFLRDFLYANRSKNGQTVLVDLHGWTQQLIGDSDICNYYRKEFPENDGRTIGQYGTGYLINWARTSLGSPNHPAKSALIELPNAGISGHNAVIQNGFPTRYIRATLDMLRNMI